MKAMLPLCTASHYWLPVEAVRGFLSRNYCLDVRAARVGDKLLN